MSVVPLGIGGDGVLLSVNVVPSVVIEAIVELGGTLVPETG